MEINEKEIKLYYPNGDPITSIDTFLDFYSKCYYLSNNKDVEDKIEEILKNGIQSEKDLFKVLAWKFGRIDMKKSKGNAFVYKEGMDEESMWLRLYSKEDIMVKSDIEKLYNIIKEYSRKCDKDKDPQEFLEEIKKVTIIKKDFKEKDPDGEKQEQYFYSVYLITILYFVSNGKYPIVDSFSYVALDAIFNHINYGTRKTYPGLPSRETGDFNEIITKGTYKTYIDRFNSFLQLIKKPDLRKVDQALWSYGKLFKK